MRRIAALTRPLFVASGVMRLSSEKAPVPVPASEEGKPAGDEVSTEVHEAAEEEEEFDLVEAALQEVHDVACAMDHILDLRVSAISDKDGIQISRQFHELTAVLEKLLSPEISAALANSAKFCLSSHPGRRRQPKFTGGDFMSPHQQRMTKFVAQYHKHAPFEILSSRANSAPHFIRACRAERDGDTVVKLLRFVQPMPHNFNSETVVRIGLKMEALVK